MNTATARNADLTTRRNAAIRAMGLDPRRASGASIRTRGDGADVWQVVRNDRFGTHIVGCVSVSYRVA